MKTTMDIYFQKDTIDYITNKLGKGQWIIISGSHDDGQNSEGYWSGFIPKENIEVLFRDCGWDINHDDGYPGFEENNTGIAYKRNFLEHGLEPLVYYRDFYGVSPNYVELSQEFILLNNLRYEEKSKAFHLMSTDGLSEEVAKYLDPTTLQVKRDVIMKYAAAKQMAFILFFDYRVGIKGSLIENNLQKFKRNYKDDAIFYDIWGDELSSLNKSTTYSVLMGKKVFLPYEVEKCGFWPYEKKKEYGNYIIGVDNKGDHIIHSCDPEKLDRFSDDNSPYYLTPVAFKKEVLHKYYSKPELYEVREGYISCQSLWGMEIDNDHKELVYAYLGDLGRDLPESEQKHWESYNVYDDEGLSISAFARDFFNLPTESNMADHAFIRNYKKLLTQWKMKFGWDLFLPFEKNDEYVFRKIRIPLINSQNEFDDLVLALTKILVDSLNEKEIAKNIKISERDKGISKLEKWFEQNNCINYQDSISFLRDLQELRSTSAGHRKGKDYVKISRKIGMDKSDFIDIYIAILEKANAFLTYMIGIADS